MFDLKESDLSELERLNELGYKRVAQGIASGGRKMKSGKGCDYKVILQPDGNIRYEKAKPLTWNERINQMTVEEKADLFQTVFDCSVCPVQNECDGGCHAMLADWLSSPCEGVEKG